MELPQYRLPRAKGVLIHMWERGKHFIIKAGTIILVALTVIWFLQAFDASLQMVSDPSQSLLADIGRAIAPIFTPLGFGNWQASSAALTGLVAKEKYRRNLWNPVWPGERPERDEPDADPEHRQPFQSGQRVRVYGVHPACGAVLCCDRHYLPGDGIRQMDGAGGGVPDCDCLSGVAGYLPDRPARAGPVTVWKKKYSFYL